MSLILVIDDDPQFLAAAERMLVRAGYEVLLAATGTEGRDILQKRHREIALAIVDLALPGINGFELIGTLTRRPNPIKIIATSGIYKDFHLQTAGELGAHAVIRKPPAGTPLQERDWLPIISRLLIGGSGQSKGGTHPPLQPSPQT